VIVALGWVDMVLPTRRQLCLKAAIIEVADMGGTQAAFPQALLAAGPVR